MSNQVYLQKTNPTLGDVHVSTALTNISIAYMQDADKFVADKVFPIVPVAHQTDKYYTYDRGFWNRSEVKKRAPNTESAGGDIGLSTDSYSADVFAVHKDIPDQIRSNADAAINLDADATDWCTLQLMLSREIDWMGHYFTTGKWGKDVTGVSGSPGSGQFKQWNDAASTPIEDVRAAMDYVEELTGFRPNTLTLQRKVFSKLLDHPDFVDRVKYGQTGPGAALVNREILAQIFEVDNVYVAAAIQNTAKQGQANAHSFIGGKAALLSYSAPNPGLMTPTAGYTMAWTGYTGASLESQGGRIKKFRRQPEIPSDRVEGEMAYDLKLVAADLGYFFASAIA